MNLNTKIEEYLNAIQECEEKIEKIEHKKKRFENELMNLMENNNKKRCSNVKFNYRITYISPKFDISQKLASQYVDRYTNDNNSTKKIVKYVYSNNKDAYLERLSNIIDKSVANQIHNTILKNHTPNKKIRMLTKIYKKK